MMKVELKNCLLKEDHEHAIPYLETYQWEDGSISQLPACCLNTDLGIGEFPSSIKRLIRVDTTNTETQMVSGIYSSELMEVDKGLFFTSFRDIDDLQTDCFFIKGTISEVLTEYLAYTTHLQIPFMQIFGALYKGILDKNILSNNWVPTSVFGPSTNWDGLNLSIKLQDSNLELNNLINNITLDISKIYDWENAISNLQNELRS